MYLCDTMYCVAVEHNEIGGCRTRVSRGDIIKLSERRTRVSHGDTIKLSGRRTCVSHGDTIKLSGRRTRVSRGDTIKPLCHWGTKETKNA